MFCLILIVLLSGWSRFFLQTLLHDFEKSFKRINYNWLPHCLHVQQLFQTSGKIQEVVRWHRKIHCMTNSSRKWMSDLVFRSGLEDPFVTHDLRESHGSLFLRLIMGCDISFVSVVKSFSQFPIYYIYRRVIPCHVLFCDSFLHLLIIWLTVSSLSPQNPTLTVLECIISHSFDIIRFHGIIFC